MATEREHSGVCEHNRCHSHLPVLICTTATSCARLSPSMGLGHTRVPLLPASCRLVDAPGMEQGKRAASTSLQVATA